MFSWLYTSKAQAPKSIPKKEKLAQAEASLSAVNRAFVLELEKLKIAIGDADGGAQGQ